MMDTGHLEMYIDIHTDRASVLLLMRDVTDVVEALDVAGSPGIRFSVGVFPPEVAKQLLSPRIVFLSPAGVAAVRRGPWSERSRWRRHLRRRGWSRDRRWRSCSDDRRWRSRYADGKRKRSRDFRRTSRRGLELERCHLAK